VTKRPAAIVLSGFLFLVLATGGSVASGYFIPLLYEIPEGSVGVFKSGDQLYDGVYTAGVYPVWPSDEALVVSILPEKAVIRKIPCLTSDDVNIDFGEITVGYRVLEGGVWALVDLFGIDFVSPLIEKPVQQAMADWCADMTAEGIFLEKNSRLEQHLMDYLTHHLHVAQGTYSPGVIVTGLETSRPAVPDEVIDNVLRRSHAADQSAVEDGLHSAQSSPSSSEDAAVTDEEPSGEDEDAGEEESSAGMVINRAASEEKPAFSSPHDDDEPLPVPDHQLTTDPSDEVEALEPAETDRPAAHEELGPLSDDVEDHIVVEPSRVMDDDDAVMDAGADADADEGVDQDAVQMDLSGEGAERDPVFPEDRQYAQQQTPVSAGLWKNNSSRLYIGW